jgi:hypothetical protein
MRRSTVLSFPLLLVIPGSAFPTRLKYVFLMNKHSSLFDKIVSDYRRSYKLGLKSFSISSKVFKMVLQKRASLLLDDCKLSDIERLYYKKHYRFVMYKICSKLMRLLKSVELSDNSNTTLAYYKIHNARKMDKLHSKLAFNCFCQSLPLAFTNTTAYY